MFNSNRLKPVAKICGIGMFVFSRTYLVKNKIRTGSSYWENAGTLPHCAHFILELLPDIVDGRLNRDSDNPHLVNSIKENEKTDVKTPFVCLGDTTR